MRLLIWLLFLLSLLSLLPQLIQAQTWQKLNTEAYPGKQDDICFINQQTGWYVNGYGRIYQTKDGGNTWTKQLEQKGTFFRCIAFLDSLRGFAGTVGTEYFPNVTDTIPLYKTIVKSPEKGDSFFFQPESICLRNYSTKKNRPFGAIRE